MARIRFAALGVALLIASAAGAQGSSQDRGSRGSRGEGRGVRGGRGEMALFRGITLSETQKSQLKQIRDRCQDQFKAQRDSMRPDRGDRGERGARQRPDSAERAARRAQGEAVMAQSRQLREREIAEMRAVLTPDQRVQFDKNVTEVKARMQERGDDRRDARGKNGRGKNGNRGGGRFSR